MLSRGALASIMGDKAHDAATGRRRPLREVERPHWRRIVGRYRSSCRAVWCEILAVAESVARDGGTTWPVEDCRREFARRCAAQFGERRPSPEMLLEGRIRKLAQAE